MNDTVDDDPEVRRAMESWVGSQIRRRDSYGVAANATARSRPRWRSPALSRSMAVAMVALLFAVGSLGAWALSRSGDASNLAGATVDGTTYTIAVARGLRVAPEMLTPYAEATGVRAFALDGTTAYAIEGISPQRVLVLKLKPGQVDDAGSIGNYLLLVRGPDTFSLLCRFFDPAVPGSPSVCR